LKWKAIEQLPTSFNNCPEPGRQCFEKLRSAAVVHASEFTGKDSLPVGALFAAYGNRFHVSPQNRPRRFAQSFWQTVRALNPRREPILVLDFL
jgi:hypothetical protein